MLNFFFRELLVNVSTKGKPFHSTAAKINLVGGFNFYLLVLKIQCDETSYFFFTFGYIILFLDPFDIFLHHPIADSPRWFRKEVQRITDKVFREELMI